MVMKGYIVALTLLLIATTHARADISEGEKIGALRTDSIDLNTGASYQDDDETNVNVEDTTARVAAPRCGPLSYYPQKPKDACRIIKRVRTVYGRRVVAAAYCYTLRNWKCKADYCPWCTKCLVTRPHICGFKMEGKRGVKCTILYEGSCGCRRFSRTCPPRPPKATPEVEL